MENEPNKKWLVISILILGGFSALLFLISSQRLPFAGERNQLAQIIAIETDLLRKWQQNNGLNNNLVYNSEGDDVILLQRMLSQDQAIYPEKKITGYYGDLTTSAVKKFQNEYGLAETGIVDTATRKKLNEIFLSHLCPEQTTIHQDFLMHKITKDSPVPYDYVPPLEEISKKIKTFGITCLRSDVVPHLVSMFSDAQKDGVEFMVTSGYRKPEIQKFLYDFWLNMEKDNALNSIAPPGLSEHQLGSAVDLTDSSINFAGVDPSFADGIGGKWLQQNAYKYGFTLSFPDGKEKSTGFKYEPWHYRFVGMETAKFLHDNQLVFNEINFDASRLVLSANSFISIFVSHDGKEKMLIEKNQDRQLPIASITKLMVALVALERYKDDDNICVSENSLKIKGGSGIYHAGDCFLFPEALQALLLASHNEIASALAERIGINEFVNAMNKKARAIGLSNTIFVNATGLDPVAGTDEINRSTVYDVYKLMKFIQANHPELFSITTRRDYNLFDAKKNFIATIINTDKLLSQQSIPFHILGGKTGETPRAKQNLAIVSDSLCGGKIFSVVLSSQNSFEDMQNLLWYINNSYKWIRIGNKCEQML